MARTPEKANEAPLVFKAEDFQPDQKISCPRELPWNILIVDDEKDVHEITKIALRGYSFENRGVRLISAHSELEVHAVLEKESDIALIIMDVVMERDDSGIRLVEHVRKTLGNHLVRIVLRTGQPGKAPEQELITGYDINDYKTKPDLTVQKLFTMVTTCLRSYSNLKTIQTNTRGLENIIRASSDVFQQRSLAGFAETVLVRLTDVLDFEPGSAASPESAYYVAMPGDDAVLMAANGTMADEQGSPLASSAPKIVQDAYRRFKESGGEIWENNEYAGVFSTRNGFVTLLYFKGIVTDIQQRLLRIYANNIAIGFDNVSLAREIINTQKEVILTLGEVVETRSMETANHVVRMAEVCYLLAQKYGLEEDVCETIRLAAPMHDVGKIGVPETILNKPGKLTPEEFEIIKGHAKIGYEILNKSHRPIMKTASIIAFQHHERWDGRGYPQGLAGEDIHLYGRIGAIADVFDALSHKRCYKEAWEMERIVRMFRAESGSHFDPSLVELFLSHLKEVEDINQRFPE